MILKWPIKNLEEILDFQITALRKVDSTWIEITFKTIVSKTGKRGYFSNWKDFLSLREVEEITWKGLQFLLQNV